MMMWLRKYLINLLPLSKDKDLITLPDLKIFAMAHKIDAKNYQFSFFLEKAYGNYLIYKTPNILDFKKYFKSKGGIYKQFDFGCRFRTIAHDLFNYFGASVVRFDNQKDDLFPCQNITRDFFESNTAPLVFDKRRYIIIRQFGKKLVFVDEDIVKKSNQGLDPQLKETLLKRSIDYVFYHQIEGGGRSYFKLSEL